MTVVEPIAPTDDTAVPGCRDYNALIEAYEDTADTLALAEVRAREEAGEAEHGPIELVQTLFVGGERPVGVWREHRGLSLGALAKESGIAQSYVSEIEHCKRRCFDPRSGCPGQGAAGRYRGSPGAAALSAKPGISAPYWKDL